AKSNPLFNVIVSESLGEPTSHRSSQKSLCYSEKTVSSQSLTVPSYVIKMGSTASITCELNSYLPEDTSIVCLKVDNELYPVAYLIVKDGNGEEAPQTEKFLSPPQTLFVMEGRTSIISCQMDKAHLKLAWYRDRTLIKENDRILVETYDDEQIDEREVTVSAVEDETDDEP
uniref:Ig-like domain-containing protein n=1 Tax=Steinernema glaseri TaxID=37863 RepID=A0A1I7YG83_9BILA